MLDNNLFKDVWITSINSKKIIQKTENLGLTSSQLIGGSKVFRPDRNEAALLGYYKNNIVHILNRCMILFLLYFHFINNTKISQIVIHNLLILYKIKLII